MGLVFNNVSYYSDIKNVTFNINSGRITGIMSGNNFDLYRIFDLLSLSIIPTGGKIIGNLNDVGYVSYDIDNQLFYDNIGDEFYFILKMCGCKNIVKRTFDCLRIVGLNQEYLRKSMSKLSSCEKKLISFSLSLAVNPDMFILYEPLKGLDKNDYDNMIRLLLMMKNKYNKTIIIIGKDTDTFFNLCDDIVLLKDGVSLRSGDRYAVLTNEDLLHSCNLNVSKTVEFSNMVNKIKKINIGYRDDINDLIKDIFRFVR